MDQQALSSLLNNYSSQSQVQNQQQELIGQFVDKIQPQLQMLVTVGIALSVFMAILVLINSIYKWRVERAILRIEKNVEKLVEHHTGLSSNEESSEKITDEKQTEQK